MSAHLLDALDEVASAQNLIDLLTMATQALTATSREPVLAGLIATSDRLMAARELLEVLQDAEGPHSTPSS